MLKVKVEGSSLRFLDPASNTGLGVTFQRTLRIPDDGKRYPLPPGLGAFPIRRVLDYKDRVPAEWVKTSGVFIPMYQREALWISFQSRSWRPNAVKIAAGKVNAVSGKTWTQKLEASKAPSGIRGMVGSPEPEHDYLTVPPQPWLDGFNTGKGVVKQFVAMPLGMGYTVEAQVTGKEEHGGIQIMVFEPKAGRFPDRPPPPVAPRAFGPMPSAAGGYGGPPLGAMPAPAMAMPAPAPGAPRAAAMGLAAGGTLEQKIYPDPHGIDTWDEANYGRVFVHIVNSVMWREITGEAAPPTPVDARAYTNAGFPWFAVYDEGAGDISAPVVLQAVKSVAELDAEHGFVGVDDNDPLDAGANVRRVPLDEVPDGDW